MGMGFDGAATFSGDKTGVQRKLKELSSQALFVHCLCLSRKLKELSSQALFVHCRCLSRKLKELSSQALFVHCLCHVLQLASVQAANAKLGIKHVSLP